MHDQVGTLTESEWGGQGTMPSFEELTRNAAPRGESSLRWLQLVGTAVLAGLVLAAVFQSSGWADWRFSITAGAIGALAVAGVVWTRGGYNVSPAVRHAEAGWAALHSELARSRRHERHFVIVGIPRDVWAPAPAEGFERTSMALAAAAALRPLLRTPDLAWADGFYVHVLLTDCDRTQAEAFLQRARKRMPHMFPLGRVQLAAFPDDGLTVGSLLTTLRIGRSEPSTTVIER